jgi:hypothetical protein
MNCGKSDDVSLMSLLVYTFWVAPSSAYNPLMTFFKMKFNQFKAKTIEKSINRASVFGKEVFTSKPVQAELVGWIGRAF